jgi:hypothetical protein
MEEALMALAFGLGCLWMTLTGIQTKLLVRAKSEALVPVWALGTSLVWGYLVRVVVLDASVILPYAAGTALGVWLARRIGARLER